MSCICLMSLRMRAPIAGCFFICSNSSVVEPAGLLQHAFGHADLADVMQQAGHVDAFDLLVAEPDLPGEMPAEQRDALAVAAGVGVLGVDRAGQAVQQAHHQAVHVVEQHRVFEIDRRFVGDASSAACCRRVEIAVGLVQPEQAAEHLVLPLQRDGEQLVRVFAEPAEMLCRATGR